MKKIICVCLLCALLLCCFAGCDEQEAAQEAVATEAAEDNSAQILAQRRDTAEGYMRSMATVLWRAGESVDYYKGQGDLHIVEGRLYRGIPYSYSAGSESVFLSFSQGKEGDVHNISGLTMDLMGRNDDGIRRVGNDCSGAILVAWSQVGNSFQSANTRVMTPANGFLRVGEYKSNDEDNTDSKAMCEENGPVVMYEAYAQLQKADAVVRRGASSGHVMMVTSVHVERNAKGNVNGSASYVTLLHQTNKYMEDGTKTFDETLGEDVYQTYGIDDKLSFFELYDDGYLPITCLEFVDVNATKEEPTVTDSITEATVEDLFQGEFLSNYFISMVDITVTNDQGEAVQTVRGFGERNAFRAFQLSEFTDNPTRTVGLVDVSQLAPGSYTCTYDCELSTGERFRVREFTFTVE